MQDSEHTKHQLYKTSVKQKNIESSEVAAYGFKKIKELEQAFKI